MNAHVDFLCSFELASSEAIGGNVLQERDSLYFLVRWDLEDILLLLMSYHGKCDNNFIFEV